MRIGRTSQGVGRPDAHQRFRVEAAKEGTNMAAVARRLVEEYLRR
jgi:hypothetical protein